MRQGREHVGRAVLGTGQTKYVTQRSDVSMNGLVREAIDKALAGPAEARKDAAKKIVADNAVLNEAMLTHPMFGPDSVSALGLAGQPIVLDRFRASAEAYAFWRDYFARKRLRVIELSADEHDRLAAYSQGVAHFGLRRIRMLLEKGRHRHQNAGRAVAALQPVRVLKGLLQR